MGKVCGNCNHGQYHGFPVLDADSNSVGTIYFWCPIEQHHDPNKIACSEFIEGDPKYFDKLGNILFVHDWHTLYENNPYVDVICASLPPKREWRCSKCGKVTYTLLDQDPEYFGCDR